MGSNSAYADERPVHRVTISNRFYIGRHEVTQAQWEAVIGRRTAIFHEGCGNCAATGVTFHDANEFVQKLNERNDGYTYRLPTEAEWEYACRAGTTGNYAGNLESIAVTTGAGMPVGTKQPNGFGLYDMHGNVREWVLDFYDRHYYSSSPETDPQGPATGENGIVRGGAGVDAPQNQRSASREGYARHGQNYVGFRVVAVPRSR